MFQNRAEAGRRLAEKLRELALPRPVVVALPRGGVPVAGEIAAALGAPLDIAVVRKVGAPGNPELALGAIVAGDPPQMVANREIMNQLHLTDDELKARSELELPELQRRSAVYRRACPAQAIEGRSVVLVDDGAATGATMEVVARAMRQRSPARIVAALPVAPPDAVASLAQVVDQVVCLETPPHFRALSFHYREFPQIEDAEVIEILHRLAAP